MGQQGLEKELGNERCVNLNTLYNFWLVRCFWSVIQPLLTLWICLHRLGEEGWSLGVGEGQIRYKYYALTLTSCTNISLSLLVFNQQHTNDSISNLKRCQTQNRARKAKTGIKIIGPPNGKVFCQSIGVDADRNVLVTVYTNDEWRDGLSHRLFFLSTS